jgi:hypothetical protein
VFILSLTSLTEAEFHRKIDELHCHDLHHRISCIPETIPTVIQPPIQVNIHDIQDFSATRYHKTNVIFKHLFYIGPWSHPECHSCDLSFPGDPANTEPVKVFQAKERNCRPEI